MKNKLESFAVLLVGLLSLVIIYLIVQYNLVDDGDTLDEIAYEIPQKKTVSSKAKAADYLQNLEGYEDVDVQVDATKENTANTVVVQSQIKNDALNTAVNDKSKSSYMQNLANYADVAEEEKLDTMKPTEDGVGAPEVLNDTAVVDKAAMDIGDDISSAVDDESKSSYMKNLDNYADKAKKEKLDTIKPKNDDIGDPEKLDQEEIVDEVGMAIDNLLDDL
jgi:hypothetical protein